MLPLGLHPDISFAEYHGDRTTIGSSGLRQVLECPTKYRHGEVVDTRAFTVGRAAHQWLADPDGFTNEFETLPEDHNGRTNAGKAHVEEIRAAGKTPIGYAMLQNIQSMAAALDAQLFDGQPLAARSFQPGSGLWEQTIVWKDMETGVRLKCRPDWLPHRRHVIPDYKTAADASPDAFRRAIWNYGYHIQAAHYLDGIEAVTGKKPKTFFFVVQEKAPPYVVGIYALEKSAIEWGRLQLRRAIRRYADCLSRNVWPGYSDTVETVDLPVWAERDLQSRHEAGEFTDEPEEKAA